MKENKPIDSQKQLLQKYLDGQCTPEEHRLLLNWFYSIEDDQSQETSDTERIQSLGRSKSIVMDQLDVTSDSNPVRKMFDWKRFSVAAAVIVLVSIATLYFVKNNIQLKEVHLAAQIPDSTGTYKNDILPGSSYAYLSYKGKKSEIKDHQLSKSNVPHSSNYFVEVPNAGTYKLELEDGTLVWLNSSSTLDYPDAFGVKERRVKLTGEAYFEVKKDKNRPFRIEVEGSTVEVLGTSFNINAYADQVNTTLVEGKVKILKGNHEHELLPGEEALIKGDEIKIQQTDVSKHIAWQRGEFYFDGNNLQDILSQIARWYDVEIINAEALTLNSSYKGSLSRELKLSEILNSLAYVTKKKFEIDGRKVIIK